MTDTFEGLEIQGELNGLLDWSLREPDETPVEDHAAAERQTVPGQREP